MVVGEVATSTELLVIGGGPAGLEAARISAERGHQVVLLEAADQLGGKLRMATRARWRGDIAGIIDWRRSELEHLRVDVRLNVLAEAQDVMAENPDVVIVATGGLPDLDWLEGAEHATSIDDLLSGSAPAMEDVVVYDGTGRHPAPTAVEWLHEKGVSATLALPDDRPGVDLAYAERVVWKRELARKKIPTLPEQRLVRIERAGNRLAAHFVHELTDEVLVLETDQVVVEHGTVPAEELSLAQTNILCPVSI